MLFTKNYTNFAYCNYIKIMENKKEDIKILFKTLDKTKLFVDSCYKYYKKNKKLSDKQFEVLLEMYKKITENN